MRQGEAETLVYATGANTYFGRTAQLVQEKQYYGIITINGTSMQML